MCWRGIGVARASWSAAVPSFHYPHLCARCRHAAKKGGFSRSHKATEKKRNPGSLPRLSLLSISVRLGESAGAVRLPRAGNKKSASICEICGLFLFRFSGDRSRPGNCTPPSPPPRTPRLRVILSRINPRRGRRGVRRFRRFTQIFSHRHAWITAKLSFHRLRIRQPHSVPSPVAEFVGNGKDAVPLSNRNRKLKFLHQSSWRRGKELDVCRGIGVGVAQPRSKTPACLFRFGSALALEK